MAAAGDHSEAASRGLSHGDHLRLATQVSAPGAQAAAAIIDDARGGNANHTEHHLPTLDQRHVDGELLAVGDEFLGAIERIDQPPAIPARPFAQGDIGVFLGQHGNVRVERLQAVGQHTMGRQIGGGYRRSIGLFDHLNTLAPERQNRGARLLHQFQHAWQQRMVHRLSSPRCSSRSRTRYSAARARPSLNCGC